MRMRGTRDALAFGRGIARSPASTRFFRALIICTAMVLPPALSARADDSSSPRFDVEVWTGADASANAWLVYGGATIAPYGDMFCNGIRFRVANGYGEYSYEGERNTQARDFTARTSFSDVLVGYLVRFGPLTAKAFAGATAIQHNIRPSDPDNPVSGWAFGPKAVAELWLNTGASSWTSLDASWTSAHETYAGRMRSGYRVLSNVSIGAETRIDGNELDKDARGGLFVRYDWSGGEVSLAGGVSGRFFEDARDMTEPYATLTWLSQF